MVTDGDFIYACMWETSDNSMAVSYTHLDVYKRQRQRYERDTGNVLVQGDGMEKRNLISYRNDYHILTEGSRGGLANYNYQSGEVGFVDAAVDTLTPVADGFPTTRDGWECYYSLSGFADGWLVWVDECGHDEDGNGTGENTTRQYFCRRCV